jgi:hypothetical protein
VDIELAPELAGVAQPQVRTSVQLELQATLGDLGIPGTPLVAVIVVQAARRALSVRVRGAPTGYPRDLPGRIWRATAPAELAGVATDGVTGEAADSWLRAYAARTALSVDGWPVHLLSRIAVEAVKVRPSCCMGPTQVDAWLAGAWPSEALGAPPADLVGELLRRLLDLGISIRDRGRVIEATRLAIRAGLEVDGVVEAACTRLRAATIEVHLHPEHLRELVPDMAGASSSPGQAGGAALLHGDLAAALREELGLRLPELSWAPDAALGKWELRLRINDLVGPPVLGLRPEESLASFPPDVARQLGMRSVRATDFGPDAAWCVLGTEPDAGVGQATAGATGSLEYMRRLLGGELRRNAHRMLTTDHVEEALADLVDEAPDLVLGVELRIGLEGLTRILRELLAEGVSIEYLEPVLDRLLRFGTVAVASNRQVVLDDRVAVLETASDGRPPWLDRLQHLRNGLGARLTHPPGGTNGPLPAMRVDGDVEHTLATGGSLSEAAVADLRDATAAALRSAGRGERPVLLCGQLARRALRDLVEPEFPWLSVLAESELPAATQVVVTGMA